MIPRQNPMYRIIRQDVIPEAPWFLLYGGDSADGRGPAIYMARTVFPGTALAHYRKHIKDNPYSTGYVLAVYPQSTKHVDENWLKQEETFQQKLRYPKTTIKGSRTKPKDFGAFA